MEKSLPMSMKFSTKSSRQRLGFLSSKNRQWKLFTRRGETMLSLTTFTRASRKQRVRAGVGQRDFR